MQQRDFLLREIEKIGLLLRAILDNLMGKSENLGFTTAYDFEKTNDLLHTETGFDLDHFVSLDEASGKTYLDQFTGLNVMNIELLAELLYLSGIREQGDKRNVLLEKALQLYNVCENTDKTYSFERQSKINRIKSAL